MKRFLFLIQAECIKWHWNWAFALSILSPVAQVLFVFIFYWFLEDKAAPSGPGFLAWYEVNGNGWNLFFMPITSALIAAISWDIEESSGGRKQMFTQPCSVEFHYIAKLVSHLSLVMISNLLFFSLLALGGILLRYYVPTLAMGDFCLKYFLVLAGISVVASFPLVVLHTWVSSNFKGLLMSLVLAVAGTWGTSQMENSQGFLLLSPWGLATQAVTIANGNQSRVFSLLVTAFLLSGILGALGTRDFRWRGKSFA